MVSLVGPVLRLTELASMPSRLCVWLLFLVQVKGENAYNNGDTFCLIYTYNHWKFSSPLVFIAIRIAYSICKTGLGSETLTSFLSSMTRLSDHLMQDYRNELPAVYSRVSDRYEETQRIQQFRMTLMYAKLMALDEPQQSVTMITEIYHRWTDFRLVWDPQEFDGIKAMHINHNKVWIPDVMPVDLISYQKNLDPDRQNVLVAYNGSVVYFVSVVISFTCRIEVWAFPFDTQECRVRLGSRNFLTSEVELIADLYERVTIDDMSNGEWKAVNISMEEGPNIVDMYGWEYPVISFIFRVQRNSSYYVLAMIIPSFLLTILVMLGIFWSQVNEENYMERLSLGFAAKLAMLMVLQITSDNMPKSNKVPILSFYILVSLILVTFAVIVALIMAKFLNHTSALKQRYLEMEKDITASNEEKKNRRTLNEWMCRHSHSLCLVLFSSASVANLGLLFLRGHLEL